jgi:pimeloyl-ACP methyl ester carboxylesterase
MQADQLRVPVGPGAMHVERFGHGGTAVILIHGFPTSSFLWRNIAPAITDAGHTAYAIDLFGHGESDRPYDSDFGIASQAEYLDAAMTALRVARGILVGVDIGGDVALRLAATRPERVERLVLINTPAFDELPARDITQLQRNTARFAVRTTRGILGAAPLVEAVLKASVVDHEKHMPTKLIARYLAPFVGKEGPNHLLTLANSISAEDIEDIELRDIHVPTLLLWGEEDTFVDAKIGEKLSNALPDGRLVSIPGVARLLPEENPQFLTEHLLDFMRKRAVA